MQEKLPPVFFRYGSYPSKTSFLVNQTTLVLRMRKLALSCSLSCAFVATIKPLKCLSLMRMVRLANEVLKWSSVKLSPLELNI